MAWMPSCELPAIRMTASEILATFGAPPFDWTTALASLMDNPDKILTTII
jgi:hypothetical protein